MGNSADTGDLAVEMVLLNFSTGSPHSAARQPTILLWNGPACVEVYDIGVEVSGNNLAVMMRIVSEVFVFDWKKGVRKAVCITSLTCKS